MKKVLSLGALMVTALVAQPPKFELADVHPSTTPRWFMVNYERNNTGHIVDGRYI